MDTLPAPLSFQPRKPIRYKARPAAPSRPPVLVAASYEPGSWVDLTFGRPVDVTGVVPGALTVADGDDVGARFGGTGPVTQPGGPATVRVTLAALEPWATPGVRLTATAASGIVAAEGGAAWAGVTDVPLPLP